jgi:hypothetical protein
MPFETPSRFPISAIVEGKIGDLIASSDEVWPELLIEAY